ncbi:MAG: MarR family winged helix-turn-helix transcriptional regulator, partial [Coriobacteriales bacterium]
IKEAVLSSNGTIPVVIGNLQKMGLVERAQDPADHRRSIVSLTDKGRALIEQIAPENEQIFREKFSVWTKGEKQELVRLLATYRKQMRTTHEE